MIVLESPTNIQENLNKFTIHCDSKKLREFTAFDYWVLHTQNFKPNFKNFNDDMFLKSVFVEKTFSDSEYKEIMAEDNFSELILAFANELSEKVSSIIPSPIVLRGKPPLFKSFEFQERVSQLFSGQNFIGLIDPLAGFPFETIISKKSNEVTVTSSVNLYITPEYNF